MSDKNCLFIFLNSYLFCWRVKYRCRETKNNYLPQRMCISFRDLVGWHMAFLNTRCRIILTLQDEIFLRPCKRMVKQFGYFAFLHQVNFLSHFWTPSTYWLFIDQFIHIFICWDTFVHSFFFIILRLNVLGMSKCVYLLSFSCVHVSKSQIY